MDLNEELRRGWTVTVFEERGGIGGVWLPDTQPVPSSPETPQTPLYDNLQTNSPHPTMALPNTTFPPETELVAPHYKVLQYHEETVRKFGLGPYIKTEHSVLETRWVGSGTEGVWEVVVEDRQAGEVLHQTFDHLIVSNGVNHYPRHIHLKGEDEWRAANRTIMHSMYYRRSDVFTGQNVVTVGGGPSGWDISERMLGYANSSYWSHDTLAENPKAFPFPVAPGVHGVVRVSSLSANGTVHLADGTAVHDVHALIMATGYLWRVPFLTAGGMLDEIPDCTNASSHRLSTNTRYLRPVYEHTLSLDPSYPLGALYFNGLLTYTPTGMANYAQGLFIAYTLAYPELLGARAELHAALLHREDCVREEGFDPLRAGHRPYGYFRGACEGRYFEEQMVDFLKRRGLAGRTGVPPLGVNYTKPGQKWAYEHNQHLIDAWKYGVKPRGKAYVRHWVAGRATEQDWVAMMRELAGWWQEHKPAGLVSGADAF